MVRHSSGNPEKVLHSYEGLYTRFLRFFETYNYGSEIESSSSELSGLITRYDPLFPTTETKIPFLIFPLDGPDPQFSIPSYTIGTILDHLESDFPKTANYLYFISPQQGIIIRAYTSILAQLALRDIHTSFHWEDLAELLHHINANPMLKKFEVSLILDKKIFQMAELPSNHLIQSGFILEMWKYSIEKGEFQWNPIYLDEPSTMMYDKWKQSDNIRRINRLGSIYYVKPRPVWARHSVKPSQPHKVSVKPHQLVRKYPIKSKDDLVIYPFISIVDNLQTFFPLIYADITSSTCIPMANSQICFESKQSKIVYIDLRCNPWINVTDLIYLSRTEDFEFYLGIIGDSLKQYPTQQFLLQIQSILADLNPIIEIINHFTKDLGFKLNLQVGLESLGILEILNNENCVAEWVLNPATGKYENPSEIVELDYSENDDEEENTD